MSFSVCKATPHKRTGTWGIIRIKRVYVERHGIAGGTTRCNCNCFVHAGAHPPFVDLAHRKKPHAQLADQFTLTGIDVPSADMRAKLRIQFGRKTTDINELRCAITEQSSEGHSMDMPGRSSLGSVHIRMRVEPD